MQLLFLCMLIGLHHNLEMTNMSKTEELEWNARYILKPKLELYFHLSYNEMGEVPNDDNIC